MCGVVIEWAAVESHLCPDTAAAGDLSYVGIKVEGLNCGNWTCSCNLKDVSPLVQKASSEKRFESPGGCVTSNWALQYCWICQKLKQHERKFLQHKQSTNDWEYFEKGFIESGGATSHRSLTLVVGSGTWTIPGWESKPMKLKPSPITSALWTITSSRWHHKYAPDFFFFLWFSVRSSLSIIDVINVLSKNVLERD